MTSHQVTIKADISYRMLDHWTRCGYIPGVKRMTNQGTGNPRDWTDQECRFVVALARLAKAGIAVRIAASALEDRYPIIPTEITLPGGVVVLLAADRAAVSA